MESIAIAEVVWTAFIVEAPILTDLAKDATRKLKIQNPCLVSTYSTIVEYYSSYFLSLIMKRFELWKYLWLDWFAWSSKGSPETNGMQAPLPRQLPCPNAAAPVCRLSHALSRRAPCPPMR